MTRRTSKAEASARRAIVLWHLVILGFLLLYPWIASPFWTVQIGAQSLIFGVIALSLTFLAGYGGMVSLAQLCVAGCAGYMVAVLGVNSFNMGLGWHWLAAVIVAIMIAILFGTLIGAVSVRTEGIYTIMITLAIAVGFYYFALQNYSVLNGYNGFAGLKPPVILGVNWRDPVPFYYLSLGVAAIAYFAVVYLRRSTFGLSLQGIRDNDRRMRALGYNVRAHRILGYAVAALIAALGGVLMIWLNGRISPGSISIGPTIDILVIAVIGGLGHPVGAFMGAVLFSLLENFAIDLIASGRFNLLIGSVFLAIVLFSPDGIVGLLGKLKKHPETPSL
ncbi:MAG: branched-chain amino acid ABC transporter permease [Desulfobacteraceae bacterium]|nr:branched-chain amino acid ABC transporter permease [Desulfobacteraceae bacterium]